MPAKAGGRGGRQDRRPATGGGGGRRPQSREVTISKALSYVLRHNAQAERIQVDEGGWANVGDILAWHRLSSLHVTFEELQTIVATNDKQRFTLIPDPNPRSPPNSPPSSTRHSSAFPPSRYLIRAAQGHSLSTISSEKLLEPILPTDADCPAIVVHGTYDKSWSQILQSGGLKPMSRRHVHFARAVPPPLPPLNNTFQSQSKAPKEDTEEDKVISGMRRDATVLVWVDVKASMDAGMKWWKAANGVPLTEGLDGKVGLEWIVWAERRGTEEVLWGDRDKGVRLREEGVGGGGVGVGGGIGGASGGAGGIGIGIGIVDAEAEAVEKGVRGLKVGGEEGEGVLVEEEGKGAVVRKGSSSGDGAVKDNWDDS